MRKLVVNTMCITFICVCVYSSRGRLLHGRHFTYKSITGDTAITFVSTGVEGAFATEEHPYAAHGPWLQVRANFAFPLCCSYSFLLGLPKYIYTWFCCSIFRPNPLHSFPISFEMFREGNFKPRSNGSF